MVSPTEIADCALSWDTPSTVVAPPFCQMPSADSQTCSIRSRVRCTCRLKSGSCSVRIPPSSTVKNESDEYVSSEVVLLRFRLARVYKKWNPGQNNHRYEPILDGSSSS